MRARVDVVILTWNDGAVLERAVQSALDAGGADVRVLVYDNGSDPPAATVCDERVTLIRDDVNRGVAGGRNRGIAHGDAPLVLLLDSDARLEQYAFDTLLAPLRDPEVAMVVPTFTDQAPEASAGRAPSLGRKVLRVLNVTSKYRSVGRHAADPWWDVDFGIGACQLFRREAYDAVGGIDESFFYGPEDVDFCLRLKQAGWRVVQTSAAVCHHPPRRRYRRPLSRRGLSHAWAVVRYLARHRHRVGVGGA